jgi:nitroreductase
MDFFELVEKRASVRSFLGKGVEEEKLRKILEAANSAPSAGNLQAYKIIVVKDKAKKEAVAKAALHQGFVATVPLLLVFLADPEKSAARYGARGRELYCIQDAAIACSYAQLAAVSLGLSSVWVGAFDENAVKEALGISAKLRPVAVMPLGYAAEKPFSAGRQSLGKMVSYA